MIVRPLWLTQIANPLERMEAENRLFLRLAALYASEVGTLDELANLIGVNPNTLKSQAISKVRASQKTRDGISRILGDDFAFQKIDCNDL